MLCDYLRDATALRKCIKAPQQIYAEAMPKFFGQLATTQSLLSQAPETQISITRTTSYSLKSQA